MTALQAFDDGGVFGGELVKSLDAPVRPAHTHTLFDCKLPSLIKAEGDVFTFLFRTETEAADIDGHDSVDLLPIEEPEALLLEKHVNFVVNAVLDRFEDLPYLTASTGELAEEDNADVVILGIGEAFLETSTFAVSLSPADVLLEDAFHPDVTGFGILEE